jgi:hypothetical protein
VGQPAEVSWRFFWREADDGQLEAAADGFGDLAEGDAFFCDYVVTGKW